MTNKKQPPGLQVLFLTELWERFGFYTVQGLLVLFLTHSLAYNDVLAQNVVGAVIAAIYIMPIIGGYLADKILGLRLAIIWGAILLSAGYFIIAIPHTDLFYIGMSAIIIGSGFFKGCISSLLGELYDENDVRRVSGFTWFYLGINIGSLLAYIFSPYIAQYTSYYVAFVVAGIGMLIGLFIFVNRNGGLEGKGLSSNPALLEKKLFNIKVEYLIYIACILSVFLLAKLLYFSDLFNKLVFVAGGLGVASLIYAVRNETTIVRNKVFALIILITIAIIFWAMFFQIFSSVVLFTERLVNRELILWGDEATIIPAASFGLLNSLFIILLSPLFAWLWTFLAQKKKRPSYPATFAYAIIFAAISLLILGVASDRLTDGALVALSWLVVFYFILVIAELLISPVALAAVTELVPKSLTAMAMGINFTSLSLGGALSAKFANLMAIPEQMLTDTASMAAIYAAIYIRYGLLILVLGVLLLLAAPLIKKLIKVQVN